MSNLFSPQPESFADQVVIAIHKKFDALPVKYKPQGPEFRRRKWVPLSGIALVKCTPGKGITSNDFEAT